MKLEEIQKLIKDEDAGRLRIPAIKENVTKKDLNKSSEILTIIVKYIIGNSDSEVFINSTLGYVAVEKAGIKSFACLEPNYKMYQVNTKFGEGTFFDARKLFENGKYPKWIRPGFCFSNAYAHILTEGIKSKILSGIVYVGSGKPFLHSAILTEEGMIVDFNYNLVMSKELYCNLFNFEVLAELESDKIIEKKEFCLKNPEIFSEYKSYEINFAFDDVMERIKEKQSILDEGVGI